MIAISFTMGSASSTHGHEWFCAFGTSARLGEFLAIRGDKNRGKTSLRDLRGLCGKTLQLLSG